MRKLGEMPSFINNFRNMIILLPTKQIKKHVTPQSHLMPHHGVTMLSQGYYAKFPYMFFGCHAED